MLVQLYETKNRLRLTIYLAVKKLGNLQDAASADVEY